MAISKVSQSTFILSGATGAKSVALPGTLLQNDIVVIAMARDDALQNPTPLTSGYVYILDQETATAPGRLVAYKRMGTTPDTTVSLDFLTSKPTAGLIQVWRGVDATTAEDIASNTGTTGTLGMPDPPGATPVTVGALVMAFGFIDDEDFASSSSAPSGYGDFLAADTGQASALNGATVMVASKTMPTLVNDNPSAFGGTGDHIWRVLTAVLRPAAEISGVLAKTLSGPTLSAPGTVAELGVLAKTLDGPALSSGGTVKDLLGTLAQTLGGPSLSSAGVVAISGALAKALGGPTMSSAGVVALQGALAKTLSGATLSSSAVAAITGALSKALAGVNLSATGVVDYAPASGILDKTLGGPSLSSAGIAEVAANLAQALGGANLSAAGQASLIGVLQASLAGDTLSAGGVSEILGALSTTLAGDTLDSHSISMAVGALTLTLGADTLGAAMHAGLRDLTGMVSARLGSDTLTSELVSATIGEIFVEREMGLAALAPVPPNLLKQTDFDFSSVSTGYPTHWSQAIGAPFLPTEVANMRHADPRHIRLYDTVAITLLFDGEPITAAHVVGPGENLTTALYWLAKQLDNVSPDFHIFSTDWSIGVQALPGHSGSVARINVTPYQSPPAPSVLIHAPVQVPPWAVSLKVELKRDTQVPELFTVPATGNPLDDLMGLADAINETIWLQAEAGLGNFRVGTHSGHTVTVVGDLAYV